MESEWSQQLYFLILPPLVDSFVVVVVERSPYACRVYRYLVLCSSSLHEGGNTYLRYTCMYIPTQEDGWSLSNNHHYLPYLIYPTSRRRRQ